MRFFRSWALAKAAKFRFEASCSAAEAMPDSPLGRAQRAIRRAQPEISLESPICKRPQRRGRLSRLGIGAAPVTHSAAAFSGSLTEPPAFSIFSMAALEA